jgi:hypothetical protein
MELLVKQSNELMLFINGNVILMHDKLATIAG